MTQKKVGINYWRCVGYEDDGHSRYQCLSCKRDWISGEAPGYTSGVDYHRSWNFCPFCSTRWEGEQKPSNRKKNLEKMMEKIYSKPIKSKWRIEYRSSRGEWVPLSINTVPYTSARDIYKRLQSERSYDASLELRVLINKD